MVKNQINHQEIGTANLHHLTSNPEPLLPTPSLWFKLSWGDLIIIPFIMVVFRFTLNSFQLNLTLNLFHIQTPLRSNQLMMIKWTISWNSSTHNVMKIFLMLTSRWFRIEWWFPLIQDFIQSLLCCFIKKEEKILQSQIACHTFLFFHQPRPLQNWIIKTRDMHKQLELFYVVLLTVTLYIKWDHFIIVQATLTTPSHQAPSNFMLDLKSLRPNLLNIMTLLTLKVVLGDHRIRLKKSWLYSNRNCQSKPSQR